MNRNILLIALLIAEWLGAAPRSGSVAARVRVLLARSPAARGALAGMLVVDEKGRRIASINADRLFIPASNTKLFSTALALEKLGPERLFETRVELRGPDLILVGTGDANLSGRVLPYAYDSKPGPPLSVIDDLAAQVAAAGIKDVPGNIVGDDSAFLYEPFAPGWAAEDLAYSDGAPVSALVVNDNKITMRAVPGDAPGAPARVEFDPPLPLFSTDVRAVTGTEESIDSERFPYEPFWRIWGAAQLGKEPYTEQWAVDDPARFAALAFKYSLEQHGVRVGGSAVAVHRFKGIPFIAAPAGTVVAKHTSLPLLEDLRVIEKTSQNLHADLLLFDAGGSREEGLRALTAFLTGIGIKPEQYKFYDGSGLSRMNLVTPEAIVKLLVYMARSPHREEWLSLLPISGEDGSLALRLRKPRTRGRIRAKTGTLNHVSALSGYAETRAGHHLTFSILLNNTLAESGARQELIDSLVAAIESGQ